MREAGYIATGLKAIELENFKSFAERTRIELAPLTLLIGPNSAGKSSILNSLLMAKQTFEADDGSPGVTLNGPLVRLGSVKDLKHRGNEDSPVSIRFEFAIGGFVEFEPSGDFWEGFYGGHGCAQLKVEFEVDHPRVATGRNRPEVIRSFVRIDRSDGDSCSVDLRHSEYDVSKRAEELGLPASEELQYVPELSSGNEQIEDIPFVEMTTAAVGATMAAFLPTRLAWRYNLQDLDVSSKVAFLIEINEVGRGLKWAEDSLTETNDPWANWSHLRSDEPFWSHYFREFDDDDAMMPEETVSIAFKIVQGLGLEVKLRKAAQHVEDQDYRFFNNLWERFVDSLDQRERGQLKQQLQRRRSDIVQSLYDASVPSARIIRRPLPSGLLEPLEVFRKFFENRLVFIGPVRQEARSLYHEAEHTGRNPIGPRGEGTVETLFRKKKHKVWCVLPEDLPEMFARLQTEKDKFEARNETNLESNEYFWDALLGFDRMGKAKHISLDTAVTQWGKHLGIAEEIRAEISHQYGYVLNVAPGGSRTDVNLTQAGFGVGQILPILVNSLLAPPGSLLILENPELHLHPAVQTRLGDFLISMVFCRKQVIVETHSNFLLDRIRSRIARSRFASWGEKEEATVARAHYLDLRAGQTQIQEIALRGSNREDPWPGNFLDPEQFREDVTDREEEFLERYGFSRQKRLSLDEVIGSGESETIEFKETLRRNTRSNKSDANVENAVLKTVAAFLNTRGGTLLIGVSDDKTVTGIESDDFSSVDKLMLHLTNLICSSMGDKASSLVEQAVQAKDDKQVLRVECGPSSFPVFCTVKKVKGSPVIPQEQFFIRSGSTSRALAPSELYDYVKMRFDQE